MSVADEALNELLQKREALNKLIADRKRLATQEARKSKVRQSLIRDMAAKMIQYEIKAEEIQAAVSALIASGGVQEAPRAKKQAVATPAPAAGTGKAKPAKKSKSERAAKPAMKRGRGVLAPKYRDPQSGKTWSGRGLQPLWYRDALNAGAKPEDLLIR